jgi:hypothetical protein
MAVRKAILILTLTLVVSQFQAQSFLDSINFVIDTNLINIKVDKLNNKWLIYENKIIRTSNEKAYNDTFENLNLHQLSLDLNVPLKNLFYSSKKNSVEIKNSRLGVISSFKLDALQIFQPSFVNFTADKMIWVLDISANLLHKLNENGVKISQKSNPFRINGRSFFPTELVQLKNSSILLDKKYGVFILDDYGNLSQSKKIDSTKHLFEFNGKVYLSKGKSLIQFQSNSLGEIDLTKEKHLNFDVPILSLQSFNENALILFEDKRIYELKNFESLFE